MPGNPVSEKKRERADAQDDLWKKTGLRPIEGKAEDAAAEAARKKRDEVVDAKSATLPAEKLLKDPEVMAAQEAYKDAAMRAFDTRNLVDPDASTGGAFGGGGIDNPLRKTIEFAESVLQMGLSYVHEFVGMLSTRLADRDARRYYRWKGKGASIQTVQSIVETEGVQTIEDLIRKNMHLGRDVCSILYDQYKMFESKEKKTSVKYGGGGDLTETYARIGKRNTDENPLDTIFRFDIQQYGDALDELLSTRGIEDATGGFVHGTKRDWVFGALDLTAFGHLLEVGTMGAISMALGQIRRIRGCERFTLKQLLMSEGVRDIFAIFVAYQYLLASGGNAYAGRITTDRGKVEGTTYMLSAGIETRKRMAAEVETAQYWFQDVYESTNPTYKQLQQRQIILQREQVALRANANQQVVNSVDNMLLNKQANIIGLLDGLLSRVAVNVADKAFLENVRDVYRIQQMLLRIPEKILVHAN